MPDPINGAELARRLKVREKQLRAIIRRKLLAVRTGTAYYELTPADQQRIRQDADVQALVRRHRR
jgi:hypothetical protein